MNRLIISATLFLIITISAGLAVQIRRIPTNLSTDNYVVAIALKTLIQVDNWTRGRLLTKEGTLIISTDNLNGVTFPSSLDGLRLELLTPDQIRARADANGILSYLRIQRIESVDSRHVNIVLSSYEAKSRLFEYPQYGYWVNAPAFFARGESGWSMRGLDYYLCAVDRVTGMGSMIPCALAVATPTRP